MKEQQKIDVAIFRFGIIQDFINRPNLIHGEQERLLQEKCARKWHIPHSDRSSIGRSTIVRWLDLYEESGGELKSLYPKERNDKGTFRALDPDTCQILKGLRIYIKYFQHPLVRRIINFSGLFVKKTLNIRCV